MHTYLYFLTITIRIALTCNLILCIARAPVPRFVCAFISARGWLRVLLSSPCQPQLAEGSPELGQTEEVDKGLAAAENKDGASEREVHVVKIDAAQQVVVEIEGGENEEGRPDEHKQQAGQVEHARDLLCGVVHVRAGVLAGGAHGRVMPPDEHLAATKAEQDTDRGNGVADRELHDDHCCEPHVLHADRFAHHVDDGRSGCSILFDDFHLEQKHSGRGYCHWCNKNKGQQNRRVFLCHLPRGSIYEASHAVKTQKK